MNQLADHIIHGRQEVPPRIMLYGAEGIGKSTWPSQEWCKPIYVPTEEGIDHLDVQKFPKAASWQEFWENLTKVRDLEHDRKTLVVDTIDWAEHLAKTDIAGMFRKNSYGEIGFGAGDKTLAEFMLSLTEILDEIRLKRNMVIVLLAHQEVKTVTLPDSEPFDTYQPRLEKRSSAVIIEWVDALLFAYEKVRVKENSENVMAKNKAVGTSELQVYCNRRPTFRAKNRYNLPDVMPFDYGAITGAIYKDIRSGRKEVKHVPVMEDPLPDWDNKKGE